MKRIILSVLKEYKPFIIVKNENIETPNINFFRIILMRMDCSYLKLELFYNSTMVMGNKGTSIGKDLISFIQDSIEVYESFEDCKYEVTRDLTSKYVETKINKMVTVMKAKIEHSLKECNLSKDLKILSINILMKPNCSVVIYYKYKNKIKTPMYLTMGVDSKPNLIKELSEDEIKMFQTINAILKVGDI